MSTPSDKHVSRRGLLAAGALGAGLVGTKAIAQQATTPDVAPEALSPRLVECAEKLIPIDYTEAERAQLLNGFENQLQSVTALRAQNFDNALAPALTFDPRLPGVQIAPQNNAVRGASPEEIPLPDNEADIAYASLAQLGYWLRNSDLTSRKLTGIYLDRIDRFGPSLECFVTRTTKRAVDQAIDADIAFRDGKDLGPLHGIPYGVKDLFDTARIPTTWGAAPYQHRRPKTDATIVEKLREAGAVLLGKTTCGALAYGDIWFNGTTRNPWNIKEGSSGSSAGSASATAAGLVGFSIGTETLGSIVSPADRCGATGLRPTYGRVSRHGAMALCWSLDKVGAICRNVDDTALVLSAINGFDVQDAGSIDMGFAYDPALGQKGLVVGYDPAWFTGDAAKDADRDALKALKKLGVKTKKITLPDLPYGVLFLSLLAESAAAFEELTLSGRDDQLVWQDDEAWPNTFRQIRFLSSVDYVQLDRLRRKTMLAMDDVMAKVDVLITPNYAADLLTITNYTGHPCLTLRAGYHDSPIRQTKGADESISYRVPRNISLIGRLFEEGQLCALGHRLERAIGLYQDRPPQFKS